MKPTTKLSSHKRSIIGDIRGSPDRGTFPLTDCNFQPSTEARSVSALFPGKTHVVSELRGFRKISSEFLGDEASRDYLQEGILFSLIVAVSAWPIISMIAVLARLAR